MSNVFPGWPNAITALITQIAPQMDVYCSFDWELQHLSISLLPPSVLGIVPVECREEFDRKYCEFTEWVENELELYDYLGGMFSMAMSEAAITEIHDELKRRIDAYEKTHPPLSITFVEFMLGKRNKPAP